jgi:hypothetical protein
VRSAAPEWARRPGATRTGQGSASGYSEVVKIARASRSRFRSANVASLEALLADVGEGEP